MTIPAASSFDALRFIEQQHRDRPGPYTVLGCSDVGDLTHGTTRPRPQDAPLHEDLFEAYAEFRRMVPQGRYAMVLGARFDPESWDPKDAMIFDTEILEAALAARAG